MIKPDAAIDLLREVRRRFNDCSDFTASALHDLVQAFVTEKAIKAGDLFRHCVCVSQEKLRELICSVTLETLGRQKTLNRIDLSLGRAESART